MSLKDDISKLLNIVSAENASDTPDFILGEYLTRCLDAFDNATRQRERWYGRKCGGGKAIFASKAVPETEVKHG